MKRKQYEFIGGQKVKILSRQLAGMLSVFTAPLNEVRVLNPYREPLFSDVDGLKHPSMPQLGGHVVHIKDPWKLQEDMRGEDCCHTVLAESWRC